MVLYTQSSPAVYALAHVLRVSPEWPMGANEFEHRKIKSVLIPVLGVVRAGLPMDAVENIVEYEEIREEMARTGAFFALQIKGDSMAPRIKEGDIVIVRKQPDVESGEIAVILVNGDEATVKQVQRFDGGICLTRPIPRIACLRLQTRKSKAFPCGFSARSWSCGQSFSKT